MKIIIGLPPKIKKNQPVALDVELFRAERKCLHRVTGKFACLSICFDPAVVYLVENEKDVPKALALVKEGLWIFHNAHFDIFHLRRFAHVPDVKFWDTFLIEKELFAGYYDSFGLEDLARRWLNEEMSKEDVKLFGKADAMTPEMRKYTARDARTTLLLQAKQAPLYPKVKNLYETIDRPALFAVLRFGGMYLDQKAWTKLATKNQLDADEMREEFDFNPNSPKQAYQALQESGISHLKSTNAKHLERHQGNKMVDDLLSYRKSAKMARTYGLNFLDMVEEDGRIHAGFHIIGAVTGRFCVAGNTKLETNLGTFCIKDLPLTASSHCTILTHTGQWHKISRLVYKGREMMYQVTTESGHSLVCTLQHRILTNQGWRSLHDINSGDIIYSNPKPYLRTLSSIGRDCFSQPLFRYKQDTFSSLQTVFYRLTHNECINGILQSFVSRRSQPENSQVLSPIISTQISQTLLKDDKHRQATVGRINCGRKIRVGNIQNFTYGPTNDSYTHQEISSLSSFFSFARFVRSRVARFNPARSAMSWISGSRLSNERRSSTILSSTVRSLYLSAKNNSHDQKTWRKVYALCATPKIRARLCSVVRQLCRTGIIRKTPNRSYYTHSPICLGNQSTQKLYSRLLYTKFSFTSRSKWINSWAGLGQGAGCTKTNTSQRVRLQTLGNSIQQGFTQPRFGNAIYQEDIIKSIAQVGLEDVWDIEVEGAHSYVAQGFINHNSSYSPNFQNIPVKDTDRFRKCFIAPRGRRLVIGDYSQQEPRINAVQAGDTKMIDLFKQGGNIYINVTKEVFGKVITKADPLYKHMKSMILGLSYGLSEKGLAMHEKISEMEARRLIQRYLWAFPKQKRYMERARQFSDEMLTVPGGKQIFLNRYAFTSANQVLDYPAQGGAANVSKMALIYIDEAIRKQRLDAFLVNFVHDEFVVECAAACASKVKRLVNDCMVRAAEELIPGVPFAADVVIGQTWADKK